MSPKDRRPLGVLSSPIGRKILTGVTGLALTLFVLVHMAGNLSYFQEGGAYNLYSDFLLSTGPLLIVIELVLLVAFVLHVYLGISIYLGTRRARPVGYEQYRSAGKPSLQSLSSRTMIGTGLVLLVFLVIHLMSFKYGPSIEEGYIADTGGLSVAQGAELRPDDTKTVGDTVYIRDLKRLVGERFRSPYYAFGYTAVMLLLGFHLRHGVWSALQSLGAMSPRLTPVVYGLGGLLAVLIAVGFLVLPLYIFFTA